MFYIIYNNVEQLFYNSRFSLKLLEPQNQPTMNKLKLILLCPLLLAIVLTSCSSQQNIANLSFVDVSLNYSSVDFEIVDLKPITMSAESLFGVSANEFNSALLDRSKFNSGNGTSFGMATLIAGGIPIFIAGLSSANLDQVQPPLTFLYGFIPTLLWASYNDLIWSNSIRNKAIQRCNYELQLRNPKFDSYINPKYNIEYRKGFAITKCTVTLNAQGVILKNKTGLSIDKSLDNKNERILTNLLDFGIAGRYGKHRIEETADGSIFIFAQDYGSNATEILAFRFGKDRKDAIKTFEEILNTLTLAKGNYTLSNGIEVTKKGARVITVKIGNQLTDGYSLITKEQCEKAITKLREQQ